MKRPRPARLFDRLVVIYLGTTMLLLAVIIGLSGYADDRAHRRRLLQDGKLVADLLRLSAVDPILHTLAHDRLAGLTRNLYQDSPDIAYIAVHDPEGGIVAVAGEVHPGTLGPGQMTELGSFPPNRVMRRGSPLADFELAVVLSVGKARLGFARVGLSTRHRRAQILSQMAFFGGTALLLMVLASLGFFLLADRHLSRPLTDAADIMDSYGDEPPPRLLERIARLQHTLKRDELGAMVAAFGRMVRSIVQAQEALRTSEAKYRLMMETIQDEVYIVDRDLRLQYVNPACSRRAGRDLVGETCHRAVFGQERVCPWCRNAEVLQGRTPNEAEILNPADRRTYLLASAPLRHGDGSTSNLTVLRDVTELKLAQEEMRKAEYHRRLEREVRLRTTELEQANRDLEGFSYSVSHDLRAPLRAINGFIAILLEEHRDRLDEEGRRLFGIVRDNTRKMSRLIDDILALAHAGRAELNIMPVDMNALVDEIWAELAGAQGERQIRFRRVGLPSVPCDPRAIRRVWWELLDNAVKFSRDRDPAIVEVGAEEEGDQVCYSVTDNGAGFNPEYAHKLFTLFERLHGLDEFEGDGVGLPIAQRLVQRHGGDIRGGGAVDAGARFEFTLPHHPEPDRGGTRGP